MTLEALTSDALAPVRHGFFSRRGGVSSGVYRGLNCGAGSSDQPGDVAKNRALVADFMGVGIDRLASVHQVHSALVVAITPEMARGPRLRADAMVTATPGIALGILTADCQPVLFADQSAGVIGAAHAGWRGAMDGVLEATLNAMEAHGASRAATIAVIGPSIGPAAYEVGPEFFDAFTANDPDNQRFFWEGEGDRLHFDLPGFGLARLRAAGVGHAEWTGHCTYSDPSRFFSYRRATHQREADYGRLISAISL